MKDIQNSQDIEIRLLLETIRLKSGYDFRDYAKDSLKRRILRRLTLSGLKSISAMQHLLLYDDHFLNLLLRDFSITVTQMFRDPPFFRLLKKKIYPLLAELPFIKIWHAGCATGEEVYSMAILLKEYGLYDRVQIYATDFNMEAIKAAKKGIYTLERIREYTCAYQEAGGQHSFSEYYSAFYDMAIMKKQLKENIVFADHNLVTDHSFGEMDLVMCRNVMIYFSRKLQSRVLSLFLESLKPGGFLCLGNKETIRFLMHAGQFEVFEKKEKIFRRL